MSRGWKHALPRRPKGQPREHIGKYHNARHCAKERGIEWQFTYDTWIAWWGDDFHRRGPFSGQLVMARHNDTGPYHPDNVSKATCNENCSAANLHKSRSEEFKEKCRLREAKKKLQEEVMT